jgi:Mrp family chromosome partitioning ATPase
VLLTSAIADEGKTTLALARQQTEAGRRVVVVDADFRRSQIAARVSGIAQSTGLSEVLAGTAAGQGKYIVTTDGLLSDDR